METEGGGVPQWIQGQSSGRDLENFVPQKLKQYVRLKYKFVENLGFNRE